MNWTPKILATLAVAAAVIVLYLWLGTNKKPASAPVPSEPATNVSSPTSRTNTKGFFSPRPRTGRTNANPAALPATDTATNLLTNWETVIDDVLRDDNTEPNAKAKQLLELYPRFPADGLPEAAQHIANLIADEDYGLLASYFTSTNSPLEVQEVILTDLLSRPNSVKLPVLLEAARTPQHAKATDAKDVLEVYLEHDYGTDWEAWQKSLEEWLQTHPD